jgi:Rrf2 family protein
MQAIIQLARHWPHNFLRSQQLAQEEGISTKFLESILLALRRGGFLESKIGRDGGYRLARAPKDIRVGDVIRRLEGRLTLKDAHSNDDRSPGEVAVHLLNDKLTQAIDEVLDQMTLEQLLDHVSRAGGVQHQMYYI